MRRPRIMVIDDEKIVVDMTRMHLQKEGFDVETFLSATPALERLMGTDGGQNRLDQRKRG